MHETAVSEQSEEDEKQEIPIINEIPNNEETQANRLPVFTNGQFLENLTLKDNKENSGKN